LDSESDHQTFDTRAGRDKLAAQASALETYIVAAKARGEDLPSEATAMLASLRDVVSALDRLAASLTDDSGPGATRDSTR
jgi:hypothetical protein